MKHTLIRYHLTHGSPDEWDAAVKAFVSAIEADPVLRGKISYRAMKTAEGDYFHHASVADEHALAALQNSSFFKAYTQKVEHAGGGDVEVGPVEILAETEYQP